MLKYYRYNKIIFSFILILLAVALWNTFHKKVNRSDVYNSNDINTKLNDTWDEEVLSFRASRGDANFSLDDLGVDLNKEIYNNSSAIYHEILQYAKNNPEKIIDIWNFSKKYDDANSVVLKSGLLILIMQSDLEKYAVILKEINVEDFSKLKNSLESDIGTNLVNIPNSKIIDLIKWNRNNPEYRFSLKSVVNQLSNEELISLQLNNTVKNIDECDEEIAKRISSGSLNLDKTTDSVKPSDAVGYMYGKISGSNVFDVHHLASDPLNFLNREKVLLGAADQIAINQDLNEIITSMKYLEPKYINRIFSYMAICDSDKTASNIDDIMAAGINADYPIAGFVEGYVNSRPNLSGEGKKYLLKMIDNVYDEEIKNKLINHEKLRAK